MSAEVTFYVSGPGSLTEIPYQYPASGSHYEKVITNDGDTSYVYNDSVTSKTDLYKISPTIQSGRINYVRVSVVQKPHSTGQPRYVQPALKTGGSVFYGSTQTPPQSVYTTVYNDWTTNPSTLALWTWSEIYALEIGAAIWANAPGWEEMITQVYVTINYELDPGARCNVDGSVF